MDLEGGSRAGLWKGPASLVGGLDPHGFAMDSKKSILCHQ